MAERAVSQSSLPPRTLQTAPAEETDMPARHAPPAALPDSPASPLAAAAAATASRRGPDPDEPGAAPAGRGRRALLRVCAGLAGAAFGLPARAASVVGSGRVVTETRAVPGFVAVHGSGSVDLDVRQGGAGSVQVQGDDNIVPLVETVVEGGRDGPTLHVRLRRGASFSTRRGLKVLVVTPRLVALTSTGSGDVRLGALATPALRVALEGSGDLQFTDLQTDELALGIAGSAGIDGAGRATRATLDISGSGDARLGSLRTEELRVRISGSGEADVQATRTLDVRISGSGDVRYGGNPALTSSISGSGEIRRR